MNTCIIDFRQVRPLSASDTPGTSPMKLRLCAQVWPNGQGGGRVVDCCCCEAMELSPNLPVISLADLVFGRVPKGVTEEQAEEAARIFASNLMQETGDVDIVCIIPDATSDFELATVRNQLKANFSSVDFLPVSIGAVFDWVERTGHEVADKEVMVVVDATPEGIQLTPVQAVYDKDTERMVWERHPGKLVSAESFFKKIRAEIKNCHFPEQFSEFPGWNGLASEAGKLTLHHGERWYELQEHLAETFSGISINRKDLESHISELAKGLTDREPTLLCATELLSWTKMARSLLCSACDGGCTWASRQRKEPETVQWYDYLPELSIEVMHKGRFELFPLVSRENRRIEPRRGKAVELSIPNHFTLPAGAKICSFPLFRGNGGTALRFTAEVHSPAFPLIKKEECRLKLTYTYGAPKPYQLTFEGAFGTASTTWQPLPEPDPDMPGEVPVIKRLPLSTSVLCNFKPSSKDEEHINLLKFAIKTLRKRSSKPAICEFVRTYVHKDGQLSIYVKHDDKEIVCPASEFFEPLPPHIRPGDMVYVQYVTAKPFKNNVYSAGGITFSAPLSPHRMQPVLSNLLPTFQPVVVIKKDFRKNFGPGALVDYHGKRVFVPKSSYTSFLQLDCGTQLYCVILSEHISETIELGAFLSCAPPKISLKKNNQQTSYTQKRKNSNKYFYSRQFANLSLILEKIYCHRNGNSGLPANFLDEFKKQADALLSDTQNLSNGDSECLDSIAVALCIMGTGTPEAAWKRMKQCLSNCMSGNGVYVFPRQIAMMIGNLSCPWQREMLDEVCVFMQSQDIHLRQIAFKVCTFLLLNLEQCNSLPEDKIYQIIDFVHTELMRCEEMLQIDNQSAEDISLLVRRIQDACTLLCLLVEFRNSKDRRVRMLLCVNSHFCQDLLFLVKALNNRLVELHEAGFSIGKEVQTPSTYEGMNESLYNLYVLLCGDADSAHVSIEDVMEDDSAFDVFEDDDE